MSLAMEGSGFAAEIGLCELHTSRREKDDTYPCVAQITPTLRVINCKDGIQWILQGLQGDQWRGLSFCRTREALIRAVRGRTSDPLPAALLALPAIHDDDGSAT
jgi:hypothetical protein